MTWQRKLGIMLTGWIVMITIAACGSEGSEASTGTPSKPTTRIVTVTEWSKTNGDGYNYFGEYEINGVRCIVFAGDRRGGLSCDWSAK